MLLDCGMRIRLVLLQVSSSRLSRALHKKSRWTESSPPAVAADREMNVNAVARFTGLLRNSFRVCREKDDRRDYRRIEYNL